MLGAQASREAGTACTTYGERGGGEVAGGGGRGKGEGGGGGGGRGGRGLLMGGGGGEGEGRAAAGDAPPFGGSSTASIRWQTTVP